MTATQNTVVKEFTVHHISSRAIMGPRNAPTVSSDWRSPKLAPRISGGLMSAMSASRGAPRMPLPTRSMNRAATSQATSGASGKSGLVSAAMPYPSRISSFLLPSQSLMTPENTLVICAVASAMPSMKPTDKAEVPSTVTM